MKKAKSKVAYTIREKHYPGGKIEILKSANAWWIDRVKVEQMILSLKMGFNWVEVALLCGISEDQRRYFFKVHKELLPGFQGFQLYPNILAKQVLFKKLEAGNWEATKFYSERKMADEFMPKTKIESEKPILIMDL